MDSEQLKHQAHLAIDSFVNQTVETLGFAEKELRRKDREILDLEQNLEKYVALVKAMESNEAKLLDGK